MIYRESTLFIRLLRMIP